MLKKIKIKSEFESNQKCACVTLHPAVMRGWIWFGARGSPKADGTSLFGSLELCTLVECWFWVVGWNPLRPEILTCGGSHQDTSKITARNPGLLVRYEGWTNNINNMIALLCVCTVHMCVCDGKYHMTDGLLSYRCCICTIKDMHLKRSTVYFNGVCVKSFKGVTFKCIFSFAAQRLERLRKERQNQIKCKNVQWKERSHASQSGKATHIMYLK